MRFAARVGAEKRFCALEDVAAIFNIKKAPTRRHICYARVSSPHQKGDLERQCDHLHQQCPDHELVRDIGSGINWKRPGLLALLDSVCEGSVAEVVVTHRDRLARIGVELLEWLFQRFGTRLVVLSNVEHGITETDELRDDLLAIVTFFVARNNGRRSAANRKRRRSSTIDNNKKDSHKRTRRESQENTRVPQFEAAGTIYPIMRLLISFRSDTRRNVFVSGSEQLVGYTTGASLW